MGTLNENTCILFFNFTVITIKVGFSNCLRTMYVKYYEWKSNIYICKTCAKKIHILEYITIKIMHMTSEFTKLLAIENQC